MIWQTFLLHNGFILDVAERVFSKCVETNKGEKELGEEVHAASHKLKVKFNYEFLEDFQDEQSSDNQSSGEEGETNIDNRYTPSAQIFLSSPAYLVIVMLYLPTVLSPGSRRNSQSTVTHFF